MRNSSELIDRLRRELSSAESIADACAALLSAIRSFLAPDILHLHQNFSDSELGSGYGESRLVISFNTGALQLFGDPLESALFVSRIATTQDPVNRKILNKTSYSAFALLPVYLNSEHIALLEVAFCERNVSWNLETRVWLERAAEYTGIHLARLISSSESHKSENDEYSSLGEWIAQAPNLVTVETNQNFTVSAIVGNTEEMLGLSQHQIIDDPDFWSRILHPSDAKKLLLKTQRGEPKDLEDEFRIVHQKTGRHRALLVNARPRLNAEGKLEGWTGFALDVTDRYEARKELLLERSRLDALYKVSRALQSSSNLSVVALRSLQVLVRATQADAGFVLMAPREFTYSEVAASTGFSFKELEAFESSPELQEILNPQCFENRVCVFEGAEDLRRFSALLKQEGESWRLAQIALQFENQKLGALYICTRKPKFFSAADLSLLEIAASQIALSIRQAELFIAEKEQASSLAALYRLSHELSQQLTAQEVIEHAVPIIKDELACKRIWLGVTNEQQTVLNGQSGIGPGMRDGISDLSIDLSIPHPFLDTAIRTRQSVIVPTGAHASCGDLARVFERLEVGTFALVPLVALGQVVGVLAVEPIATNSFFGEKKRQLLDSMASEIATIILARRFESRVADSAKMRMAALLSSGVAHNFNNLLQAIMGQASLIELDSLSQEQRAKIAGMIMDAASRGAKLVKQLYSFSSEATFSPDSLSVRSLLLDLKDRFRAQLGANVVLEYKISDESLEIKGDSSMIQQVFTNLIENAKEALEGSSNGVVKISASRLRIRSGEVNAELAPGSYVGITVEDNGQGMTEEQVERCFEPFYSTKNVDPRTGLSFSGAGLGLSAAYLIIRQHEGAIIARSQKGQGSSFSIYLPVVTLRTNTAGPASIAPTENRVANK